MNFEQGWEFGRGREAITEPLIRNEINFTAFFEHQDHCSSFIHFLSFHTQFSSTTSTTSSQIANRKSSVKVVHEWFDAERCRRRQEVTMVDRTNSAGPVYSKQCIQKCRTGLMIHITTMWACINHITMMVIGEKETVTLPPFYDEGWVLHSVDCHYWLSVSVDFCGSCVTKPVVYIGR